MKLVTFEADGWLKLGAVYEGKVADLAALAEGGETADFFCCVRCFLEGGEEAIAAAGDVLARAVSQGAPASWPELSSLKLHAPVPDPRKIFALAGNYREHIREGGGPVTPKEKLVPKVFIKPVTCVVGHEDEIVQPGPICTTVDYEAEMGVVIGDLCFDVSPEEAMDYVAGYVNFNDVSGRSLNIDTPRDPSESNHFFDWLNGKWFDTFAPMGPFLVLKDEVPDPHALDLELWVNGETRQKATTGDMIFTVPEIVSWISKFVTLEPGDIIATGTTSGVGATTGTYLQAGDVVEMQIGPLGRLRNPVAPPIQG